MTAAPTITNALLFDLDADTVTGSTGDLVETVTASGIAFTQATSAARPSLRVAGLGGHNALRFDGTDDRLTATVAWPGTYSIFVVSIPSSASSSSAGEVAGDQVGSLRIFQLRRTAGIVFNSAGSNASTASPSVGTFDVPRIFGMIRDANTAWAHRDGEQTATVAITGTPASGTRVIGIGQATTSGQYMTTDIARVLVFNGVVAGADFVKVCSWAQDTYGITVADYVPSGPPPAVTGYITASAPAAVAAMSGEVVPTAADLTVDDAVFALAADTPAVGQATALTAADATLSLAVDAVTVTASTTLTVDDVTLALAADSPQVATPDALAVDDVVLTLAADTVTLTQATTVAVDDATFGLAADDVTVGASAALAVDDVTFAPAVDPVAVTAADTLAVADVVLGLVADSPTLTTVYTIAVDDAALTLTVDTAALTLPVKTLPADRTLTVAYESRTRTIPAESRTLTA